MQNQKDKQSTEFRDPDPAPASGKAAACGEGGEGGTHEALALPCPFCGAEPAQGPWKACPPGWAIECGNNLTKCPAAPCVTGYTMREALAAWNQRPTPHEGTIPDASDASPLQDACGVENARNDEGEG